MSFDLESYISNYTGHTKINRLIFIAEHSPELRVEAGRMAINELKKTTNTTLYREVTEKFGNSLGPDYTYDDAWASSVDAAAQKKLEKLELELNAYKSNLIKESIRMGHNDLGDFFYDRGDLPNALKCYVRTRDYCTANKHIISMCLNVIRVSIEMENYALVNQYVSKAEQTPDLKDPIIQAKLKCAAGLANLDGKKYKQAARKFLEIGVDLGSNFSEVMSAQDVAIYGALCALATFDRRDLKTKCIDDVKFKNYLELVPQVRELIKDFYASRYTSCLKYLDKLKPELLLDIHLHDHVEILYEQIRNKALVQYVSPFTSVDLRKMANTFSVVDVTLLEKELAKLIMDNQIQARIDSHNKVLYARHTDQRNITFQRVMDLGDTYIRETESQIRRMNLMRNDFVVRAPRRPQAMHHHPGK